MSIMCFKPVGTSFPEVGALNSFLASGTKGTGIFSRETVKKLTREAYPSDLEAYSESDSVFIYCQSGVHPGTDTSKLPPLFDDRLPGYWFASTGAMSYRSDSNMSVEQHFLSNVLVPIIQNAGLFLLSGVKHDMRSSGARMFLWSGKSGESPYFYGVWYARDGIYYSSYVPGSVEVGKLDHWWNITFD